MRFAGNIAKNSFTKSSDFDLLPLFVELEAFEDRPPGFEGEERAAWGVGFDEESFFSFARVLQTSLCLGQSCDRGVS